ncbi:MAG TPA: class I SAM-dependent methyltransferase [Chthonomonadaceae bacterium]|nr:class I SAM-dependent methyltransferase [Chthonomonadaceae bacterium]
MGDTAADERLFQILKRFHGQTSNRGHADRRSAAVTEAQLRAGIDEATVSAAQFIPAGAASGLVYLDVGCSWGSVAFGLAASDRVAEVVGIDVEAEAVEVARALSRSACVPPAAGQKTRFELSAAEKIPFPDDTFDGIVCHTVLEHVYHVETALLEMVRVLKPGGRLYLEAPNYVWPYEPHLHIWMLPLGPKWLVKLQARRKMRRNPDIDPNFVDHLQFVHPVLVERMLKRHGIRFQNTYLDKLDAILVRGDYSQVIGLRRAIPLLRLLRPLGVGRVITFLARALPFYPSLRYVITKE